MTLGIDSSNKLELTTGSTTILSLTKNSTTYIVSSNSALSTTEYSHIVGRIYNNTMNLYINNNLIDSIDVNPFALETTFTYNLLGCDLSNNNLFKGSMAYFKTWLDYGLLTNEITDLYDNRIEPEPEPEPEPEEEEGPTFNKIKLYRTATANTYVSSDDYDYSDHKDIYLHELQCWVNNQNIIPNTNVEKNFSSDAWSDTSYLYNNQFLRDVSGEIIQHDRVRSSFNDTLSDYILITLDRYYILSELQSIVLYPCRVGNVSTSYSDTYDGRSGPGLTIDLQRDYTLLYRATITEKKYFYRFDGNADFSTNTFTPSDASYNGYIVIGDSIRTDTSNPAASKIINYPDHQQVLKLEEFIF